MEEFVKALDPFSRATVGFELAGAELRIRLTEDPDDDVIEVYRSADEARLASDFLRERWLNEGYRPQARVSLLLSDAPAPGRSSLLVDASGQAARVQPKPKKRLKVRDTLPLSRKLAQVVNEATWDGERLLRAQVEADDLASVLKTDAGSSLHALEVQVVAGTFARAMKAVLAKPLPALRELTLCSFRSVEEFAATDVDATPLLTGLRQVEQLALRAGKVRLKPLDESPLRKLELGTGVMPASTLEALAATRWPRLEALTLWLGSASKGATYTVDLLAKLFASEGLPALRKLELHACEPADDLVDALLASKLLPQLQELTVSHSLLGDRGARALAEGIERWRHLAALRLQQVPASGDALAQLQAASSAVHAERYVFDSVDTFVPG